VQDKPEITLDIVRCPREQCLASGRCPKGGGALLFKRFSTGPTQHQTIELPCPHGRVLVQVTFGTK
jgi:hypothetical protein